MDPLTLINTAKVSLDAALTITKLYKDTKTSIEDIEQKAKLTELKSNILDAKDNVLELRSILIEKDEKILKLKNELKVQHEMKFIAPVYWQIANNKKVGPYCQKCYDDTSKLARLQNFDISREGSWKCTICDTFYASKEYEIWRDSQY